LHGKAADCPGYTGTLFLHRADGAKVYPADGTHGKPADRHTGSIDRLGKQKAGFPAGMVSDKDRTNDCTAEEGKQMNRQECEYLIGCLLEDVRRVVKMYDPEISLVSMYISERTSSAWALTEDKEENEYQLKVDISQEVTEDEDC
jgi:hypothetical protein